MGTALAHTAVRLATGDQLAGFHKIQLEDAYGPFPVTAEVRWSARTDL